MKVSDCTFPETKLGMTGGVSCPGKYKRSCLNRKCDGDLFRLITGIDSLNEGYRKACKPRKASGVDGLTFEQVQSAPGRKEELLKAIRQALINGTYKPDPILRVLIPKPSGERRPLGIPTLRDRVLQATVLKYIQPIIDPQLSPFSYGFRPGRNQHQAIRRVADLLQSGYLWIFDADIKKFFDQIPHRVIRTELLKKVNCPWLCDLVMKWVKAPVVSGKPGRGSKDLKPSNKRGTPQGESISPMLANICLDSLDQFIEGLSNSCQIQMVRYADDFIIMAKLTKPVWVVEQIEKMLKRLGLRLNWRKSSFLNIREKSFDFLGFTFSANSDASRIHVTPKKSAQDRIKTKIEELLTQYRDGEISFEDLRTEVKRRLKEWSNYYNIFDGQKVVSDVNEWAADALLSVYEENRPHNNHQMVSKKHPGITRKPLGEVPAPAQPCVVTRRLSPSPLKTRDRGIS